MQINKRCRHKSPQVGAAGFTLIEVIIVMVLVSILGTFIFQVLTKSLGAQIAMQTRKERADDAVMVLERISREVRAADTIDYATTGSNELTFTRPDTSQAVRFIRNTSTFDLWRQSAGTVVGLPPNSTSGDIVAENVTFFEAKPDDSYSSSEDLIIIDLEFDKGSRWRTKIYPRNYPDPP